MVARLWKNWRRDAVSCSLVMVGRTVAAPGVEGGGAAVVVMGSAVVEASGSGGDWEEAEAGGVGAVFMVAGGSEEADTKLVGFLLLPGTSLSLYGCLLGGGRRGRRWGAVAMARRRLGDVREGG